METRRLGRTGHASSVAILGAAAFWQGDPEVAALPQWSLVHAVEAMSTQTTPEEHALVAAALAVAPRPATAGSDAHDNEKAGAFATVVADHVRTPADLAAEIRAGRVAPVRR